MKNGIMIFGVFFLLTSALQAQQDSVWSLEECITHALEKNIQVRKGELSNERYQYYADQSRAQRFPSVNASLTQNYNRSKASGGSGYNGMNGSNVSMNSSVTVFNGSRLTNQIKQAGLAIRLISRRLIIHRSFIVNLERIETIERSRIIFGKTYIPVSEQYKDKFQEFVDKNFL